MVGLWLVPFAVPLSDGYFVQVSASMQRVAVHMLVPHNNGSSQTPMVIQNVFVGPNPLCPASFLNT